MAISKTNARKPPRPATIPGWTWKYDSARVIDDGAPAWELFQIDGPAAVTGWRWWRHESVKLVVTGNVPQWIVAKVYAVNRNRAQKISAKKAVNP